VFIWLRIKSGGCACEHVNENLSFVVGAEFIFYLSVIKFARFCSAGTIFVFSLFKKKSTASVVLWSELLATDSEVQVRFPAL
jgi:hypothetical protein